MKKLIMNINKEARRMNIEKKGEGKVRVILLMMMMVMMGCNSGGVKGEGTGGGVKSLSEVLLEVGRSAENVFYSFLELVSDSLGFAVKATTKKNEVGNYFDRLGKKLEIASGELEKVAEKASADVDKEGMLNKGIRAAVDSAKMTLSILKGHLESLKGIGDVNVVGEAASNAQGVASSADELKSVFKALKGIVDIADKEDIEKLVAGDLAVKVGNNGTDNKDGVKILATDNKAGVNDAGKAAAVLTTVSGKEILASIVKSTEGDADTGVGDQATANTSAVAFAKGGNAANLAKEAAKAAAVSGGIVLRSLVKNGKLSSGAQDGQAGGKEEVQAVGISAVNKLLVAVEDIIKKTVKNVLEKVKKEVDKARDPKAVGQQ
ncbi:vlp protein, alpha subfamily (plasmid) [Borrelia duttonii Ly]|uniref:Variable large protein n=2 Tax=Borrelia duttonii TaxID=40834 RepID=B5RP27_BORDL|nr:vlp protein, alpha subfamily [Borrelia duttonii Ly]